MVILSKYQNDSVAIVPIKTFNTINLQLAQTENLRKSLVASYKVVRKQEKIIRILKDSLNLYDYSPNILLKQQLKTRDWQYEILNKRYERSRAKTKSQKRLMIGGSIVSVGLIGFILAFK